MLSLLRGVSLKGVGQVVIQVEVLLPCFSLEFLKVVFIELEDEVIPLRLVRHVDHSRSLLETRRLLKASSKVAHVVEISGTSRSLWSEVMAHPVAAELQVALSTSSDPLNVETTWLWLRCWVAPEFPSA